jgi:hypothetical protein
MKKILTDAAAIGSVTARALTAYPRLPVFYLYPGERVWTNPFLDGRFNFLYEGATLLDSRIYGLAHAIICLCWTSRRRSRIG